jgi:cysteine desulfurase
VIYLDSAAVVLADARARVAAVFGYRASEVVFTSGGTVGANLAVTGIALAHPRGRHIVATAIEHPAVLESCDYLERFHGFEITRLGVDRDGLVGLPELTAALRPDTTLVSVMYANNEIGTVQLVAGIARVAHAVPRDHAHRCGTAPRSPSSWRNGRAPRRPSVSPTRDGFLRDILSAVPSARLTDSAHSR